MNIEKKLRFIEDQNNEYNKTKGYKRLLSLFDSGTFSEIDAFVKSADGYAEVITGYGLIDGVASYAFCQDSDRDGGAMSKAQLKKIKKVCELAAKTGIPIIGIYDSIGAKLSEGNGLLDEYGEVLKLYNNLSGVVPRISVILGANLGTNAMLSVSSDFVIMQKSARLGISTIDENASSNDAEDNGLVHIVAINETDAINKTKKLISMFPINNLSKANVRDFNESVNSLKELDLVAQNISEPNNVESMKKVVAAVCDSKSFIEIQPKYGLSIITGFGRLGGYTIGIVSSSNNQDGIIDEDSSSKASRMIRFCDAFSIPIITIINSKGFSSLKEATKLSCVYSEATTAKVNLIVGKAYGAVYIAIAGKGSGADATIAWPSAVISPLEPKTAVQVLLNSKVKDLKDPINDKKKLIRTYEETGASAFMAASDGFIDDIICPVDTRSKLLSILDFLEGKRVSGLPKKHSNIPL